MPAKTKEELVGLEPEPAQMGRRRDSFLNKLQEAAAGAEGPLEQVLRKMHDLVASTHPAASFRAGLYREVANSFVEYFKVKRSGKPISPIPALVSDANDFVLEHATSLKTRMEKAGIPLTAAAKQKFAKATSIARDVSNTIKDEMDTAPRRETGEFLGCADAAKGEAAEAREVPEDLKNWVNPALGRIGNK